MKEIGELFKESREEIGVKIEEAASDLEITEAQLENLEDGNVNAFKDIFFLKDLIKKYCKYLNLDEEEVLDNFNDFVFDFTSRIPVEEIEEKIKEQSKTQEIQLSKTINSPYTQKSVTKAKIKPIIFYILLIIIIIILIVLFLSLLINKPHMSLQTLGGII